jgi:hypothetical protein
MPDLLLLLLYFETAYVLLELPLFDPVIVLAVLQLDLCLLLQLGQLIQILEHQMLHSLFVDLDLDLILLIQVLEFSLLVSQSCLHIVGLLLGYNPEVVDALPLILIHAS